MALQIELRQSKRTKSSGRTLEKAGWAWPGKPQTELFLASAFFHAVPISGTLVRIRITFLKVNLF